MVRDLMNRTRSHEHYAPTWMVLLPLDLNLLLNFEDHSEAPSKAALEPEAVLELWTSL